MPDKFENLVEATVQNFVSIIKTVTSIDAESLEVHSEPWDSEHLLRAASTHPIVIRAAFTAGLPGGVVFLFDLQEVTAMADVFIGGTGLRSTELSADHRDAVAEIFNQLGGGINTKLRSDLGVPVGLGSFEVIDLSQPGESKRIGSLAGFVPVNGTEFSFKIGTLSVKFYMAAPALDVDEPEQQQAAAAPARASRAAAESHVEDSQAVRATPGNLDLLMDVTLPVTVRLGQTSMILRDVMRLGTGSLIELNKTENEPVDFLVNDKILAKGEVVVVEGNYAIRIIEIESRADRIKSLA